MVENCKMKNILNLKPNTIIGDLYEGSIVLDSWKGFQSRQGPYCAKDKQFATGELKVFIYGNAIDYVKISSIDQINALNFLFENQEHIKKSLLSALQNELPELTALYDDLTPSIERIEDFSSVIGLSNIHVLNSEKENYAYVGYEFGCEWEEEHGLGIMTHKDKIISIGQADTAFDCWTTFEDKGTIEMERESWKRKHSQTYKFNQDDPKIKPWWKFW